MTSRLNARCATALAALLFGPLACESLTTPDARTTRLELLLQFENVVDTANIQTGDMLDLIAWVVTETDTTLPKSQLWASASNDTIQVVVPDSGRFQARRVGRDAALVEAVVNTDFAGDVVLHGALPLTVRGELFLGTLDPTTVRFGDQLSIDAPSGQRFGASTRVLFTPDPDASALNFIPGFVRSRTDSTSLTALVPAGFDSGRITVTEIVPDGRTLDSQATLTRPTIDNDLDGYEINNSEAAAATISAPFPESVLSVHSDVDEDFFKFQPSSSQTLGITLIANVDSKLDFEVYHYDLLLVKITDRPAGSGSNTISVQAGVTYYLRVYAEDFVAPTTYLLTIE